MKLNQKNVIPPKIILLHTDCFKMTTSFSRTLCLQQVKVHLCLWFEDFPVFYKDSIPEGVLGNTETHHCPDLPFWNYLCHKICDGPRNSLTDYYFDDPPCRVSMIAEFSPQRTSFPVLEILALESCTFRMRRHSKKVHTQVTHFYNCSFASEQQYILSNSMALINVRFWLINESSIIVQKMNSNTLKFTNLVRMIRFNKTCLSWALLVKQGI